MAVLVTGGAGFIGTHVCVELINSGYTIVVVDNLSTCNFEGIKRVKQITGKDFNIYYIDLSDKTKLAEVFELEEIDTVIHLAGYKSVTESTKDPLKYYRNNFACTVTLCEVMQLFGVKRLVFSSSATVYSTAQHLSPISESSPLNPTNPYGRTKQMIETFLRDVYASDMAWGIMILRYFNPIGAHKSGLIGEDPKGIPNNLVPYITQVAVGKLPTLFIYGNDYPTKDGTGVRDYIHVVDLALGHVRALKSVEKSSGLDIFNLGTGQGYSVLEVIRTFEMVANIKIPFVYKPRRSGDAAICYADVTKAEKYLEWRATRGLEEMCKDAWRWQQLHPNGYDDETAPQ